jgi:hypothetical protein
MSERRSSGWASLQPVEGRKTIYALGDSLTVRGYIRGGERFRDYGLINIRGRKQWLSLLVDAEGRLVATAAGATEEDVDRGINVQTESLLGERFSNARRD